MDDLPRLLRRELAKAVSREVSRDRAAALAGQHRVARGVADVPAQPGGAGRTRPAALEAGQSAAAPVARAGAGTQAEPARPALEPLDRRPEQRERRAQLVALRAEGAQVVVGDLALDIPEQHAHRRAGVF